MNKPFPKLFAKTLAFPTDDKNAVYYLVNTVHRRKAMRTYIKRLTTTLSIQK